MGQDISAGKETCILLYNFLNRIRKFPHITNGFVLSIHEQEKCDDYLWTTYFTLFELRGYWIWKLFVQYNSFWKHMIIAIEIKIHFCLIVNNCPIDLFKGLFVEIFSRWNIPSSYLSKQNLLEYGLEFAEKFEFQAGVHFSEICIYVFFFNQADVKLG